MKFTKVFDIEIARVLLKKGFKIIDLKQNRYKPNFIVFCFEGDIRKEVDEVLSVFGKR